MKSTRLAFVLVSIVTLILLVGSLLLQRVVFRAAESDASVYLAPTNFIVKPSGQVKLSLISDFSTTAYVASLQLTIDYDQAKLSFVEAVAAEGFDSAKVVTAPGRVQWALTPDRDEGIIGEYRGITTIGQLRFSATLSGSVVVSLDPSTTIISAIDPVGETALYNAVDSVQSAAGEITELATQAVAGDDISAIERSFSNFLTQRAIRSEVLPLSDQAAFLLALRDTGKVRVEFGLTENLGGSTVSTVAGKNLLVKVSGLEPNRRYFYRITILSPDNEPLINYPIRSFTTTDTGTGLPDPANSTIISLGDDGTARLVVVLRDKAGNTVDAPVSFSVVAGEAVVEAEDSSDDLKQARVRPLISSKQTVTLGVRSGGISIGEVKAVLEPETETETAGLSQGGEKLEFTGRVALLIAGLVLAVCLAGLALARLLRGRP